MQDSWTPTRHYESFLPTPAKITAVAVVHFNAPFAPYSPLDGGSSIIDKTRLNPSKHHTTHIYLRPLCYMEVLVALRSPAETPVLQH